MTRFWDGRTAFGDAGKNKTQPQKSNGVCLKYYINLKPID